MQNKNITSKRVIYGFLTDFGGQILVMSVNIITIPLILKFTSVSLYGFWITTSSIIGFLALTDFGIGMPLTRAIAKIADNEKSVKLNQLISTGFILLCCISILFIIIGITLSFFLAQWFNIPINDQTHILSAYYVAVLATAISLPFGVFSNVLNGFQKMAIDNVVRNILTVICILISLILLNNGFGLLAIALSNFLLVILNSTINYIYSKKYFPNLKIRFSFFSKTELKHLLSFGGLFQLGRIANTIALSADNLVIAGVLGTTYVTSYSLTSKLPNLFSINIATKLPNAVFPAISKMFSEKSLIKLQKVFIKLTSFSVRLAIMAATFVFLVNEFFITIWVGINNYGGTVLNLVFVYWILQDTIYRSTTAIIFASGNIKKWTIASIAEAVFNIFFSILLAQKIGIIGVALGTSISKTITTGIFTPYFICQELKMSFKSFIKLGIFKPLIFSIPGILLACFFSILISKDLGWIWIALVGMSIFIFNIIFFEAVIILKYPELTIKDRINKIISIE
jgi:O-antigen/teichoic acid export membrane protein